MGTYRDIAPKLIGILQAELRRIQEAHATQKTRAAEHAMEGEERAFFVAQFSAKTSVLGCQDHAKSIEWLASGEDADLPQICKVGVSTCGTRIRALTAVPLLEEGPPHIQRVTKYSVDPSLIGEDPKFTFCSQDADAESKKMTPIPRWEAPIHSYAVQVQLKPQFTMLSRLDFLRAMHELIGSGAMLKVYPTVDYITPSCSALRECRFDSSDGHIVMDIGFIARFCPKAFAFHEGSGTFWVDDVYGWRHLLKPIE